MKNDYRFRHPKGRNIEVMFRFRPGKWISTGTEDRTLAQKFAEDHIAGMGTASRRKEGTTLREFAQGFFTCEDPRGFRKRLERRGSRYEEVFFQQHQARLDNYILPAHGDYLIGSISDVMIEDFLIDLERRTVKGRGKDLCNSTKNKILACYRLVLQEAVRQGYARTNQAREVVALSSADSERGIFSEVELERLFPEEEEKLMEIWGDPMWATYFLILRDTGWRPGEAAALRVDNYFPELHGVFTTSSVDFRTHRIKERIKTSSRGQKYKDGFLQKQTAKMVEKLIASRGKDSPYLFCYRFGGKEQFIYPDVANKHLKASAERAGVRLAGRTQYCFRHTFNTYYIGRLPEMARLILMGHTKNRKEYDHLTPEQSLRRVLEIEGTAEALGIG